MKQQKTFHKQSGSFLAKIAENMPEEIPSSIMQAFQESPQLLARVLKNIFTIYEQESYGELAFSKTFSICGYEAINQRKKITQLLVSESHNGPFSSVSYWKDQPFNDIYSDAEPSQPIQAKIYEGLYDRPKAKELQLILAAHQQGIYREYSIYQACLLANKIVKEQLFKGFGSTLAIYIANPKDVHEKHKFMITNKNGYSISLSPVSFVSDYPISYVLF